MRLVVKSRFQNNNKITINEMREAEKTAWPKFSAQIQFARKRESAGEKRTKQIDGKI